MTSTAATRQLSFSRAIAECLYQEMERDEDVVVMGEDIGRHGGIFAATKGLQEHFGDRRVLDTPISETGFVGMAIGAAIAGKRPVAELMFMDFVLVAADQMWNQASKLRYLSGDKLKIPLTVRTQHGVGRGTAAQHSYGYEGFFASMPGFDCAVPYSPADAKGLLATAIRDDHPTIVVEHKALYGTTGDVPEGEHLIPFGKAVVRHEGTDVTLVAYGRAVQYALDAAGELASEGIRAEVIDLRTIVPLDLETVLLSVAKTTMAAVVHETHRSYGPGAEIAQRITEAAWGELAAPVKRIGGLDIPVPYAESLESVWLPTGAAVAAELRAWL